MGLYVYQLGLNPADKHSPGGGKRLGRSGWEEKAIACSEPHPYLGYFPGKPSGFLALLKGLASGSITAQLLFWQEIFPHPSRHRPLGSSRRGLQRAQVRELRC